jgi:hypothetical protein
MKKITNIKSEDIEDLSVRSFEEFLNEQYGKKETSKREKADVRLKKIEAELVENTTKILKK